MTRTISLAEHVEEIPLADPAPGGALRRLRGKVRRQAHRSRLLVTDDGVVVVDGRSEEELEIPWGDLRKAVVDDGSSWGYVSGVCRFPVYDLRADGSGSGVLIGPLWSQASSLMPVGCPVDAVEPVPGQAPNLVLIVDSGPRSGSRRKGGRRREASVAALLLRVHEPQMAREALAARDKLGDVDHDDLEHLGRAAGQPRPGRREPGAGASAATA